MNALLGYKLGDTIPFVSRISVQEDGSDITDQLDFSNWKVECQYKAPDGTVMHDVTDPFVVPGGPLLDCSLPSSVSSTLAPNVEYRVDVRIKDEEGTVRSTATRKFKLEAAVSETPL